LSDAPLIGEPITPTLTTFSGYLIARLSDTVPPIECPISGARTMPIRSINWYTISTYTGTVYA